MHIPECTLEIPPNDSSDYEHSPHKTASTI